MRVSRITIAMVCSLALVACGGGTTAGSSPGASAGEAGAQGVQGPAGPQGAKGDPGPAGAPGPQGLSGAPGADGRDGVPGTQGPAGTGGAAGPQGPAGAPGTTIGKANVYAREQGGSSPSGVNVDLEVGCKTAKDVLLGGSCDSPFGIGFSINRAEHYEDASRPATWHCASYNNQGIPNFTFAMHAYCLSVP